MLLFYCNPSLPASPPFCFWMCGSHTNNTGDSPLVWAWVACILEACYGRSVSVHPSACIPPCLCLPACLPVCLSACLPVYLPVSACLSAWLCVCLPVCLPSCLSVCPGGIFCVDCVFTELLTQYTSQIPTVTRAFIPVHITMAT